jgi:hypothetical protein
VAGAAYAYRVSSIAPTGERGTTQAMPTVVRGAPLVDDVVHLAAAPIAVSDGRGNFATASFANGFTVTWSHGGTLGQSPVLAVQSFPPFVRLDAAGLPHTVYDAAGTLTHGWSDGTAWHEEPIAPMGFVQVVDIVPLRFDLDAAGAPVVVWTLDARRYQSATKAAGVWTVQSLDTLIDDAVLTPFTVFTDGSGVAHAVVSTIFGLRHLELHGGTWTSELVASNTPIEDPMVGGGADPDHLVVCSDASTFGFFVQPACVRKTPAGWSAPAPLGVLPEIISNMTITGQVAVSADGQQVAVLYQAPSSEMQLFRSTAGGAWTELALPALATGAGGIPTASIGFDGSQKLFMLVDPTAASDAGQASVAYRFSHAP